MSFLVLFFYTTLAFSSNQQLETFLKNFNENPSKTMNQLPPKFDENGQLLLDLRTPLSDFKKENKFIEIKESSRKKICGNSSADQTCDYKSIELKFDGSNDPKRFFYYGDIESKLENLSDPSLLAFQLSSSPWSGDYWATFRMGTAARYNWAGYPNSRNYNDYLTFFEKFGKIDYSVAAQVDNLSPAEKYDLLLNDTKTTLRDWSIRDGANAFSNGTAETWFGICHGWAAAAIMVPRPTNKITLTLPANDINLSFYPHDIKALTSLLWANALTGNRFLGGRCNDKNPETDENGRIISSECDDLDPGSWHITTVNQMGVRNKSFVIDATYDYEVWNQPVYSYKLSFFNPETREIFENPSEAIILYKDYTSDIFKKYRNSKAKYIVGVSMNLTYITESRPNHLPVDDGTRDLKQTVMYVYDLELDANQQIIGGEWYQNAHPDFLWAPLENTKIWSIGDPYIKTTWNNNSSPPQDWLKPAQYASDSGQPLAVIVERLIQLSNID